MHPILILGYVLNLVLVAGVFGFFGLVGVLGLSAGIYYLVSKDAGEARVYLAQILAIGVLYLIGIFAVSRASWADDLVTVVFGIIEVVAFFILVALGRK